MTLSREHSLAVLFHETYERLAPQFGYETRTETRAFDPTTPNGRLMIAVCKELLESRALGEREAVIEECARLRSVEHLAWHLCESSEENAQTGEIKVDRDDFLALSAALPESHPQSPATLSWEQAIRLAALREAAAVCREQLTNHIGSRGCSQCADAIEALSARTHEQQQGHSANGNAVAVPAADKQE